MNGSKALSKDQEDGKLANNDDDARSTCTVVPGELMRVDNEDDEHTAQHEAYESDKGGCQSWFAYARHNQHTWEYRI